MIISEQTVVMTTSSVINLPYSCPSVASAFGDSEQHKIMVCRIGYRSVLWPIICKVMNQYPSTAIHHRLPDRSIRVVWGSHQFNVWTIFVESFSITSPLIQPRLDAISNGRIRLQVISKINIMPTYLKALNIQLGCGASNIGIWNKNIEVILSSMSFGK